MAKYERIDEKTPSGGDYSEIYYLDDEHNIVDSERATQCVIRECKKDGTLIQATYGFVKKLCQNLPQTQEDLEEVRVQSSPETRRLAQAYFRKTAAIHQEALRNLTKKDSQN